MPRSRSGLAGAAAILLLSGCRSPEPGALASVPTQEGAPRIVVAPMNLPIELAPDLEDVVEPVTVELLDALRATDARLSLIFGPDAWSLWRDSADALRRDREGEADLAAVASVFSRALAQESAFDLLVLPSLVFREAQVMGRYAHWDGVRRRIRFRLPPGFRVGQLTPDPVDSAESVPGGSVAAEYRGQITGLSLHALVFTPDGRGVFQGFGGLDLVHDTVRARDGGVDSTTLRLRRRLLENPEHVREGIAHALHPYLVESRAR